jgi:hypothetical protein
MFSDSFTSLSANPENILSRSLAVKHIVLNYPYLAGESEAESKNKSLFACMSD